MFAVRLPSPLAAQGRAIPVNVNVHVSVSVPVSVSVSVPVSVSVSVPVPVPVPVSVSVSVPVPVPISVPVPVPVSVPVSVSVTVSPVLAGPVPCLSVSVSGEFAEISELCIADQRLSVTVVSVSVIRCCSFPRHRCMMAY